MKCDVVRIFAEIVELRVGESLLFGPTAMLNGTVVAEDADVNGKSKKMMQRMEVSPQKLGMEWMKMGTAINGSEMDPAGGLPDHTIPSLIDLGSLFEMVSQ